MTAKRKTPEPCRANTVGTWSQHGQRREHGRLDAPDGPFMLADGLAAPGGLPLADAAALVTKDWQRQQAAGQMTELTAEKMTAAVERLTAYGTAVGAVTLADLDDDAINGWIFSNLPLKTRRGREKQAGQPPGEGTLHYRRGLMRQFSQTLRALGLDDRHLGVDVDLPRRTDRIPVPLTEAEAVRCRDDSQYTSRQTLLPVVTALALTGESTAEVAMARICDVRLDDRLIWAHGGNRRTYERWLPLDEWMVPIIQARIDHLRRARTDQGDLASLTYNGDLDTPYDRKQSAICNSLRRVLYLADVTRPGVRPTSFSEYVAVSTMAATGRVEIVAARLGLASLDRAAFQVGYDWLDTYRHTGPDAIPDTDA